MLLFAGHAEKSGQSKTQRILGVLLSSATRNHHVALSAGKKLEEFRESGAITM
jgi:hypothetical protein